MKLARSCGWKRPGQPGCGSPGPQAGNSRGRARTSADGAARGRSCRTERGHPHPANLRATLGSREAQAPGEVLPSAWLCTHRSCATLCQGTQQARAGGARSGHSSSTARPQRPGAPVPREAACCTGLCEQKPLDALARPELQLFPHGLCAAAAMELLQSRCRPRCPVIWAQYTPMEQSSAATSPFISSA